MSEVQPPPEPQLNGAATAPPPIPPPETTTNPPKRQRRPSVRLGDIGDHQHIVYNHNQNRKFPAKNPSKNKPVAGAGYFQDSGEEKDFCGLSWKPSKQPKRGLLSTKRIKPNWVDDDISDYEYGYDFDDQSLNLDNGLKEIRVRVSDSDDDGKKWKNNSNGDDDDDEGGIERNGVKVWLNQLGLGRYFPVFEVHEVDDEVLPLLTLEDLKDMGINAVGSRRKMFCSIQKLGKGFS